MLGNETASVGTRDMLLAQRLLERGLLLVQVPPTAAAEADTELPHRVVYWSAVSIEREAQRLEREYTKLLIRLRLGRLLQVRR